MDRSIAAPPSAAAARMRLPDDARRRGTALVATLGLHVAGLIAVLSAPSPVATDRPDRTARVLAVFDLPPPVPPPPPIVPPRRTPPPAASPAPRPADPPMAPRAAHAPAATPDRTSFPSCRPCRRNRPCSRSRRSPR